MSSAAPSNAAPSNAERKLIGGGRDGGGRVCCTGWLDYDVVEGTGAVQATGSEADEEVGSVVYPSGGRDGRGAELLPDYNSVEGMGAALPHLTMRRWRPLAWWYGSQLALGGGVARDGSQRCALGRCGLRRGDAALGGVPSAVGLSAAVGPLCSVVRLLAAMLSRKWSQRQRRGQPPR